MSSARSTNESLASVEVSLFINGESFVGRELARRVLRMNMVQNGRDGDGDGDWDGDGERDRDGDGDGDGDGDDGSGLLMILLSNPSCVRFFTWVESTYIPASMASVHASVWSSQLEHRRTMMSMMGSASLSVVCRDLFYFRQLLCEIYRLFFLMSKYGFVVEKPSEEVDWQSVLQLLSCTRYRPYLFGDRIMRFVTSLHYGRDPIGCILHYPGNTFLHFLCRHDHAMLPQIIRKYQEVNMVVGGVIHSQHRDERYGSPSFHFRMMHDVNIYNDDSDQFARNSTTFALLRNLFRQGQAHRSANLIGGDDYGQPL